MVRCLVLFVLMLATPALADDAPAPPPAPTHAVSARAEVTAVILHGEEIGQLARVERLGDGQQPPPPTPDRLYRHLPNDQIRIDFY